MHEYDHEPSQMEAMQKGLPRDEELSKTLDSALNEAAERVTFHRMEVERWERIGRAAHAALITLKAADPVQQASPDSFSAVDSAPGYR